MSTRELAYSLIDRLDEKQLDALIVILSGMSGVKPVEEIEPDEEELRMIAEAEADDSEAEPVEDFARRLGIDL